MNAPVTYEEPDDREREPDAWGFELLGRRSQQQDYFCIRELKKRKAMLLVLADGMGGHPGGDQASKLAVNGFVAAFDALLDGGASVGDALSGALDAANACVRAAQEQSIEIAKMGTTLVGAYLSAAGIAWISVGDSPLWLFREGHLERLNEDHSLRQLKKEGAKVSGNMLRSAVSGDVMPLIDHRSEPVALYSSDLVILTSDGILTLSEDEIAALIQANRGKPPRQLAYQLIDVVDKRGKPDQDNCAVIVAGCAALGCERAPAGRLGAFGAASALLAGLAAAAGLIAFFLYRRG
jgi:PPM family protein phosphatase